MKKPSGGNIRKPTDTNQLHLDTISPVVYPEIAKAPRMIQKPGPLSEKTMKVGKNP
jgi:hypothetical protein